MFFCFTKGIGCGAPPSRIGATASATIGYLGENVTYACDQSHVRVGGGSGHVTCNLSALWEEDATDSVPLCLGKFLNGENITLILPCRVILCLTDRFASNYSRTVARQSW